jgi:lysine 2,3-aminomutase
MFEDGKVGQSFSANVSDEFSDSENPLMSPIVGREPLDIRLFEDIDPELYQEITLGGEIDDVRHHICSLLERRSSYYYSNLCRIDDLERVTALECLQVLRNLMSERYEALASCSSLETLIDTVNSKGQIAKERIPFMLDFLHIVKGTLGKSGIYREAAPDFLCQDKKDASITRSDYLDELAFKIVARAMSYPCGMDPSIIRTRYANRVRILSTLGGTERDWADYRWHLTHVIKDSNDLLKLVELTPEEVLAIDLATSNGVPFGITPYYVSLIDRNIGNRLDHAIRAQVIPTLEYVKMTINKRGQAGGDLDFMMESHTSPVELVTRRYPMIAIFKPYNSCAQICSYCQRNWAIKNVRDESALASPEQIDSALYWFEKHPMVSEVLITGGDPAVMPDSTMEKILKRFSYMRHIRSIRIGTRLPVVLPMRFSSEYVELLAFYHEPPRREICLVTHIEHPFEVTPEAMKAVQSIRAKGMMVYNQQVFTFENCRRFETAALRMAMKQIGVDPYYTFNTKGKEETMHFRVPIARILQERKEEARLLPGLSRTDEPVFNIPGLGKNHLRAGQHHEVIMITPKGERVYQFHPWEKNIARAPTYIYRDIPLAAFLERLHQDGEDVREYRSIWYYF